MMLRSRPVIVMGIVLLAMAGVIIGFAVADSDSGDADDGRQYSVHINFNKSVSEADIQETQDILREYDPDVDMAILESFPPQGSAIVETTDSDFCDKIVETLEARSYIDSATCSLFTPPSGDGDEPVSTTATDTE